MSGTERSSSGDGGARGASQQSDERSREANRIHCKETRDRRRERERALSEHVELLKLCQSIVEHGPDLFSLHNATIDAPFSYLCDNFTMRLQMSPEAMVGRSLLSIVDERDALSLRNAVFQVLNEAQHHRHAGGGSDPPGGAVVHVRIAHGQIFCEASMSIACGSHGLVVVTRLYSSGS